MSFVDKGFPAFFEHPSAGGSELEARFLAIRWRAGADEDAKRQLVEQAQLTMASAGDDRRPAVQVNKTDGLWWVQRPDDERITDGAIDLLAASVDVDWVAPGYRTAGTGTASATVETRRESTVYAINPTRVYVRQPALDAIGGAEAVRELSADTTRRSRMPDWVPMRVQDGTAMSAAGAVATSLSSTGIDTGGAVRFETIPFFSPTTAVDSEALAATFHPNDPIFGQQWNLQRIEALRAWQTGRGDPSVVIAVIDTGVELGHPDLDLHPQSWNASTDTPNGGPTENHGTACAGIAAARLDNALGVAGVAGGAKIMAIATETWADVDIAEGLYFAADNGARVVSMSFGVYDWWGFWDFDMIRDALQYAYDQGLLLVAASGNEDGPVSRFPGSDARTLCVGGSNRSDERKRPGDASAEPPWVPKWGASYGPDVDVVAPCLQIWTTDRLGGAGYDVGDYYGYFNGTSAATPQVAGLAALLFSLRPELSNVEVRHLIESTCDKISANRYQYRNVAAKPSGSWHEEVGYGRINADRALRAARP